MELCRNSLQVIKQTSPQAGGSKSTKDWILLDDQSTTDIFGNKKCLSNARKVDKESHLHTNAGTLKTNQQGHLQDHGDV